LSSIFVARPFAEEVDAESPPSVVNFNSERQLHPLARHVENILGALKARGINVANAEGGAAIIECVAREADPFARVMNSERYARFREEQAGWGVHTGFRFTVKNGVPIVAAVPEYNNHALRIGDEVIRIGGEPAENLTLGDVLARLRGQSETTLALTVKREGVAITAEVTCARAQLSPIELAEIWPRDIGYARINGLFRSQPGAVLSLLREWEAKNLAGGILDLRGAGGDDISGAAALAEPFASPGSLLFTVRDREENNLDSYRASGDASPITIPIMVLADETTSGAAEIFAAVATDSVRGVLTIGRPTAGDPCIRDGIEMPDGNILYIAVRQIVTGNGARLDGRAGAAPNIIVTSRQARPDYEPDGVRDRRGRLEVEALDRELRDRVRGDVVLQRALDIALGLKALNIRARGGN
jgi:carboxyl-terminal processing protease